MDNIFSTLFGAMIGKANRGEVVGRDEVGDYTIDTCYTLDAGWETAVWKGDGDTIIVGRYASKEGAAKGHEDWVAVCELCPTQVWSIQYDRYEKFEREEIDNENENDA